MTLITIMMEFCQNNRLIDQKSMDKLSILSFFVRSIRSREMELAFIVSFRRTLSFSL
ncbi:MAG: hypothetical protein GY865_14885 [candidate division Zixibacteria bacterium]|nr:hypothetical protein [candidate division Zixibacteria bacterium]